MNYISSPSQSESWTTDAAGNFTNISGTSETVNKQNEVTAYGSASLTYDGNGNMTTDQNGNTLVYNAWNELVAYKNGGTTLETMSYDGLGRQVVQNTGTATDLYNSDLGQVLEEQVGGSAKINYVWSPVYVDAMVLRDRDSTGSGTLSERLWVQQDANWNVMALVSASSGVVERYIYDPYGNVTVLSASWSTLSRSAYAWIYGHQGGRFDAMTGLYGFRNRELSAVLDRWVQVDPLGFLAGQTNFYEDVDNDAVNALDPYGLKQNFKPYTPKNVPPYVGDSGIKFPPGFDKYMRFGPQPPPAQPPVGPPNPPPPGSPDAPPKLLDGPNTPPGLPPSNPPDITLIAIGKGINGYIINNGGKNSAYLIGPTLHY